VITYFSVVVTLEMDFNVILQGISKPAFYKIMVTNQNYICT